MMGLKLLAWNNHSTLGNRWIYMVFILDMSGTRVMLICFVHAKHNDLGIFSTWFMGSGDSSLKVHNWCYGCPTPKELTGFISVNLTMEKAGKECRDASNYTTSPLSCCTYSTSFAKERTTLAIQHSHIRRTIGCLIWELRKCCILLLRKQDSFEPLSLLYKLWWNLLTVFYSKFLWCKCWNFNIVHVILHILHGKLVLFSAS